MKRFIKTHAQRFWASLALLSIELIIILILFIVSLFLFLFLARSVFLQKKENFDERIFAFIHPLINDVHTDIMVFFTFLGTHTFLIPANLLLIFYFLFIRKHKWYSIKVPVVSIGSVSLMFLLKFFFSRPRPNDPLLRNVTGFSFPSGHAMVSFTFYGLLIFLVWENVSNKWVKWILMIFLFLLILIIGVSRVYLRVHYASDVLAGYALGLIWLVLSVWVVRKIENVSTVKVDTLKTAPATVE